MLRQVDVIRTNFYVFLFRTPQFSLQKRLQMDILRTANINHVNMVLFMKHVCVQYAAEPNLHIYMTYHQGDLRLCQRCCCSFKSL